MPKETKQLFYVVAKLYGKKVSPTPEELGKVEGLEQFVKKTLQSYGKRLNKIRKRREEAIRKQFTYEQQEDAERAIHEDRKKIIEDNSVSVIFSFSIGTTLEPLFRI